MPKRLFISAAVSAALLAAPVSALDLGAMTDAERQLFRDEVRSFLMENPQVIMDAVAALEAQQAEERAMADVTLVEQHADEIFDDGYSWVGGNPDGDITLVEFLDYRCGFCKRAHGEIAKLLESDGNIRLIVKEFPILGEQSVLASRFAVATKQIAGDESYGVISDALMQFDGQISIPALRRLAETFDLDFSAIETHMDSDDVTKEIADTRALAQKLRISGTPTFVLEDEMLRGFLPYDQMRAVVDEKRG